MHSVVPHGRSSNLPDVTLHNNTTYHYITHAPEFQPAPPMNAAQWLFACAGMSYALLAGLPAVYGLYGAFVPVLVYSIFGSSPHLAVGPVAVTSLLLGQALRAMFPESKNIDDPNNPGDLADVQTSYNVAAIQVYNPDQLPSYALHTTCTPASCCCLSVSLLDSFNFAKLCRPSQSSADLHDRITPCADGCVATSAAVLLNWRMCAGVCFGWTAILGYWRVAARVLCKLFVA